MHKIMKVEARILNKKYMILSESGFSSKLYSLSLLSGWSISSFLTTLSIIAFSAPKY